MHYYHLQTWYNRVVSRIAERLKILGNKEITGKSQNFIEWYPNVQSSSQNENFVNTSKKLFKNKN